MTPLAAAPQPVAPGLAIALFVFAFACGVAGVLCGWLASRVLRNGRVTAKAVEYGSPNVHVRVHWSEQATTSDVAAAMAHVHESVNRRIRDTENRRIRDTETT